MNVSCHDFAFAEVDRKFYAVGDYGMDGDRLSSVGMHGPEIDR